MRASSAARLRVTMTTEMVVGSLMSRLMARALHGGLPRMMPDRASCLQAVRERST